MDLSDLGQNDGSKRVADARNTKKRGIKFVDNRFDLLVDNINLRLNVLNHSDGLLQFKRVGVIGQTDRICGEFAKSNSFFPAILSTGALTEQIGKSAQMTFGNIIRSRELQEQFVRRLLMNGADEIGQLREEDIDDSRKGNL